MRKTSTLLTWLAPEPSAAGGTQPQTLFTTGGPLVDGGVHGLDSRPFVDGTPITGGETGVMAALEVAPP
jgi:hypothetical protein